jgi:hypothetical protein
LALSANKNEIKPFPAPTSITLLLLKLMCRRYCNKNLVLKKKAGWKTPGKIIKRKGA